MNDMNNKPKPEDSPREEVECKSMLADLLKAMKDLNDNATDTYWIGNETVFERMWSIYIEHGGDMEDLKIAFPLYC